MIKKGQGFVSHEALPSFFMTHRGRYAESITERKCEDGMDIRSGC